MSWSDAARRAAMEARRLHSATRGKLRGRGESVFQRAFQDSGGHVAEHRSGSSLRRSLAKRIREIRAAKFLVNSRGTLTAGGKMIIKDAATSTSIRNYLRHAGKAR